MIKQIQLTRGQIALVDEFNFEELNKHKWYALKKGRTYYAVRNVYTKNNKKTLLYMHRAIMNTPKGMVVDHKDGNGYNNLEDNLRLCTHKENTSGKRSRKTGSSKYCGVSFSKSNQSYRARIIADGKGKHLGYFKNEIKAALVYDDAARRYFGEYAWLNFAKKGERGEYLYSKLEEMKRQEKMDKLEITEEDVYLNRYEQIK